MKRPFWRARLLPLVVVLAVVNGVALAAWTLPRALRQRNAAERASQARVELEQERARAEQLRQRADAIRANRRDLERFYATLAGSEKRDLLPTLAEVERLAREPGLVPLSRSLRREELVGAPLERVSLTLPLEGSYAQLVGFLALVERSERFLTVDRVALRADAESGGALQVELSTYLRRAPGEPRERRRGR